MIGKWHVKKGTKTFGPYSTDQLRKMVDSGKVGLHDLVLEAGGKKWRAVSEISNLLDAEGVQVDQAASPRISLLRWLVVGLSVCCGLSVVGLVLAVAIVFVVSPALKFKAQKSSTSLAESNSPSTQKQADTPVKSSEQTNHQAAPRSTEKKAADALSAPPERPGDSNRGSQAIIQSVVPGREDPLAPGEKPFLLEKTDPAPAQGVGLAPPDRVDPKPTKLADRIIKKLFAPDSTKFLERGYAGYALGDSFESLAPKIKISPREPHQDESWVKLNDDDSTMLFFSKGKMVGVTKYYRGSMRDNTEALIERFGKASKDRIFEFPSIPDQAGREIGDRLLIKYCFPQTIVYGYMSSGYQPNLVKPHMLVTVFDRDYLEGIFRRDIDIKERVIEDALPVIRFAFREPVDWDKVPFPAIEGGSSTVGINRFKEKEASLIGKSGAKAGIGLIPEKAALCVCEETRTGGRKMWVAVCFNSFPAYETHPLLAAQERFGRPAQSQGSFNVEHDVQLCNGMIIGSHFPSPDGSMDILTVRNSLPANAFINHEMVKMYKWSTIDKLQVQVAPHNTIMLVKPYSTKID